MTIADVAGTIGYLMVAAAGMLAAWILFTRPWRAADDFEDDIDDDFDGEFEDDSDDDAAPATRPSGP